MSQSNDQLAQSAGQSMGQPKNQVAQTVEQLFVWMTSLTKWMTIIAAGFMGVMMVVVFTDIVGTKFFKSSIPGALDITEELMVFLTLLPLAYLAATKGHINITLLASRLSPRTQYFAGILKYLIATFICGILTWRVSIGFLKSWGIMQLKHGLDLPTWPAHLATVISFAVLTFIWLLHLARMLLNGSDD